ncbi:MAG TPA: hypothetical protein VG963_15350, partial [Polyangiaceae bacterium]|nr:hypothetical protein [Polyangiaceae bacterium]
LTLDFGSDDGSFHSTAHAHEALLLRPKEGHDGALPSANAVAARALARLGSHFGRSDWLELAEAALEAYGQSAARAPRAFATTLSVLERLREPPLEVVTVGKAGSPDLRTLLGEIAKVYLPNATWAHAGAEQTQNGEALPLTRDKPFVDGSATLYVCRNFSCQGPIIDASMARAELARASAESLSHEFEGASDGHASP